MSKYNPRPPCTTISSRAECTTLISARGSCGPATINCGLEGDFDVGPDVSDLSFNGKTLINGDWTFEANDNSLSQAYLFITPADVSMYAKENGNNVEGWIEGRTQNTTGIGVTLSYLWTYNGAAGFPGTQNKAIYTVAETESGPGTEIVLADDDANGSLEIMLPPNYWLRFRVTSYRIDVAYLNLLSLVCP